MITEHPDISTYQKVAELMAGRSLLEIAPHTILYEGRLPGQYKLALHNNDIVIWRTDGGLVLSSCGYLTALTAERLRWALPEPWTLSVYLRRHWSLHHPAKRCVDGCNLGLFGLDERGEVREVGKRTYYGYFRDGMVVWPDGRFASNESALAPAEEVAK